MIVRYIAEVNVYARAGITLVEVADFAAPHIITSMGISFIVASIMMNVISSCVSAWPCISKPCRGYSHLPLQSLHPLPAADLQERSTPLEGFRRQMDALPNLF